MGDKTEGIDKTLSPEVQAPHFGLSCCTIVALWGRSLDIKRREAGLTETGFEKDERGSYCRREDGEHACRWPGRMHRRNPGQRLRGDVTCPGPHI